VKKLAIIIPGWGSPLGLEWKISPIKGLLKECGYDCIVFQACNMGFCSIEHNSDQLVRLVEQHFRNYAQISLIGHSMGGLIARHAESILNYGPNAMQIPTIIDSMVTIGTPHGGTYKALFAGWWSPSAKEMLPGSDLLKRLEKPKAKWLCVSAKSDEVVWPMKSSRCDLADRCELLPGTHTTILFKRNTALEIINFLEEQSSA
jgi:triacylglycerol lipase